MPLFVSSSGVHINGGNFYDISGNLNLQTLQPAMKETDPLMALQFGPNQGTDRLLAGPNRHDRQAGSARLLPYDRSHRPGRSDDLPGSLLSSTTTTTSPPSLSEIGLYPSSQLESGFHESSARHHHTIHSEPSPAPTGTLPFLRPISGQFRSPVKQGWSLPALSTCRLSPPPQLLPSSLNESELRPSTGDASRSQDRSLALPGHCGDYLLGSTPRIGSLPTLDFRPPETNINGGTFISTSENVSHIHHHGEAGLHILYRSAAGDASHDSGDRYLQPQCHPETRTNMLEDLQIWSSGNDPMSRILWLHGPAGAGKSAIAQSFCQKLEAEGRLGGSFFFKRGHPSRGNSNKLFPTIAYQLALLLPDFKQVVSRRMEDDPSIVDKILSTQLQKLIIEPCQDISFSRTFVIVIDGLDECESQHVQQEILRCIGNSVDHRRLRFLVASRPEPHITEVFREPCLEGLHHFLNIQKSFEDVHKYLVDEFARIHRDHRQTMTMVSSPWPSQEIVDHLVKKSSGYFIYASTVVKFIDDKNFRPTERLEVITGITEPYSGSPFAALDQLYTQILAAATARPELARILTVIAANLDAMVAVSCIEELLDLKPGDVLLALRGLHSVINLRSESLDEDDEDSCQWVMLEVHHASFLDFLNDSTRSGVFHVGDSHRTQLAHDILKTFSCTHSATRNEHLAWELVPGGFTYLTSAPPVPDLLPFLRTINPDYLFYAQQSMRKPAQMTVDWLKKIRPLPQDLIPLWEDYCFMLLYADMWSDTHERMGLVTHEHSQNFDRCRRILQACPQFSRYLHACRIVSAAPYYTRFLQFFDIRLLLGWSWDDTRAAFSVLRGFLGPDASEEKIAGLLTYVSATDPPLFRGVCSSSALSDLARNCLHTMKNLSANEFSNRFRRSTHVGNVWSYLLRSCSPCLDLLGELELVSANYNLYHHYNAQQLHNTLQWLMTFPKPPPELTTRYEHYLEKKIQSPGHLEPCWEEWQYNLMRCDCFGLRVAGRQPSST
ncbi:hypothetical protein FB451DRAFT_685818 [Mycena latifolia]|nr:hypothetical protein FB451DRAFT_685818 [Mycena latifolia]